MPRPLQTRRKVLDTPLSGRQKTLQPPLLRDQDLRLSQHSMSRRCSVHLVAELTTLGSLLAICAATGAVVGYTLQHLRRQPNPRADFVITVSIVSPILALMLLIQLF